MRTLIWATFLDIKFKSYLLGILITKYQKWDRYMNIFLALVSSSSVASWVIWKDYSMVWSSIIVISQVLTVIKPYIPYFKYVKELNIRSQKLDMFCIDFEKLWYDYQNKFVTEEEASKKYFSLKMIVSDSIFFGDDIIFSARKIDERKANEKMQTFLKANYNIEIQIS